MGKGDQRSRRGKIVNGSYGARRPHRRHRPSVKLLKVLVPGRRVRAR
ncbi:MAG TPA: 30S ribosomal protein THX [Burkholderiaceae bacterium]|jgi:ribosomal small subunit protein bTHX|nr:30S ribosomal protein THX [Burkholderiaceae bacterium]